MSKSKRPLLQAAARLLGVVLVLFLALAGLASPTQAAATSLGWHYEYPTLFAFAQYCLPYDQQEPISVSATYVVDYSGLIDSAGNLHTSFKTSYKDVSAVGMFTGIKYLFVMQDYYTTFAGPAGVYSETHKIMLVGPTGTVLMHDVVYRYTINADGSVANVTYDYTSVCH